ncbi:MAG: hypothetical protein PVF81_08630 [Thioalkalispiraceae bacterium]|jgi:hypothetical protein
MNEPVSTSNSNPPSAKPAANGWRTFGIVVITVLITLGIGYWLVTAYLFPDKFTPVQLSQNEQQVLDQKLQRIGVQPTSREKLEAKPYSEAGASRDIYFTEKELNAMLAKSTDMANRLAIDLSDNLASALLLVDLDPSFPLLGGQTVKVTAGMELGLANGKPRAVLKGVSLWGVPLPNAWLGNMKNKDLIAEFGQAGGFWQAIHDGVESIEVKDGELHIRLKP